jgi:pyochelin biosynthesis protein PchG
MSEWRPRVVVCGTGFGRVYLAGARRADAPVELVGILARGSARSRECARRYDLPLYTSVDQLPASVEMACVVVGSGINGGRGAQLAMELMARGIHVLQEHPLHHDELAGCLRAARRHGVAYHLNTHYVHLDAVARFVAAAGRLRTEQPPLFVDAVGCVQVLYPLLDVIAAALGGVRPWRFAGGPGTPVLRTVDGTVAGVPTTLRVQSQLDPRDRDNGGHVLLRVTLGMSGGTLLLANPHGPVLWTPRLHMPPEYADAVDVLDCPADSLDVPALRWLTPPDTPSYRQVVGEQWPAATARALAGLRQAVLDGEDPLVRGQYHLALCRLTADVMAALGRPEVVGSPVPDVAGADRLLAGQVPVSQFSPSAR